MHMNTLAALLGGLFIHLVLSGNVRRGTPCKGVVA